LKKSEAVLITAGAGIGIDSGLPDFRGNTGFWEAYPYFKDAGMSFIDAANPTFFRKDPHKFWFFYGHRYNSYRDTIPHKGFQILLDYVKSD
jgi:NAD-dependent SIR2 family protein deacetylase